MTDTHYYFVLEPGGIDDGPYKLHEISRRIEMGLVSRNASLCKTGDTLYVPVVDARFAEVMEPMRRAATGTQPPPIPEVALTPFVPPPGTPAPALAPTKSRGRAWMWGVVGAVAVGGIATGVLVTRGGHVKPPSAPPTTEAMVRVTTPTGTGAGFFINGPDQYAYVATANHVVDRGERVLVERDVGSDKQQFVEAYPETEIVASDPDADLAIIRIKNVDAARFPRLPLATEPAKDAKILSYGYPGSSLAKHAGLVSKDGKVLSIVSFPAYDERYARVLRDNAVEGLLISTDIEPGMSGGPTCNDAGEVVGINVTKDRAHTGQNGAVSVTALRALVAKVKPASEKVEPKPDDVVALLDKIQTEYLMLPLEERSKVRETDYLNAGDLPSLRQLVGEVRREERNTDPSFIAKYRLSGQAALGMYFARLPGKLLETYRAPSTTAPLVSCELANQRLTSFLVDLPGNVPKGEVAAPPAGIDTCDELAVRPLAWDLVAATLQWDGKDKKYAVTKIDRMDDEGRVFKASLRVGNRLMSVWLGVDRGQVHLKLFDPNGALYAIKSPRSVDTAALQGTWVMKRPRVTDSFDKDAEVESTETVSISIGDDRKVSIRHVVSEHYYGAGNRAQGRVFKCSAKKTVETGLLQSFTGTLEDGVIVAFPDKEAELVGADAATCSSMHRADRIVAVKLTAEGQLDLYRTDGNAYPENLVLVKDSGIVAPGQPTTAQ